MHRLTVLLAATSVALACGVARGENEDAPLVPELSDLNAPSDRPNLTGSMRLFENVIDQARTSTSYAIGENMEYNKQRKEEIKAEVEARHRAMNRLDTVVGLQYDQIRDEFGGEIPPEYAPTVGQLQRQHEVMQSRLLKEMEEYTGDLATVDGRLAQGAAEYEIAKVREMMMKPLETLDPDELKRPREGELNRESLAYLQRLSEKRVMQRAMRIASFAPKPVSTAVIDHLIFEGS